MAGLRVQISLELTAERIAEHAKLIEGIENQEVKDLFVRSEPGTYSRVLLDGFGHVTTDENGDFSREFLPPGNYQLLVLLPTTPANQDERNMPTYSSTFQLTPGLDLDLGDIVFYEGTLAEYRDEVAHWNAPATLRIETGEPGLSIYIWLEGSGLLNMEATSDSEGVAIVELRESRLARIDVTGQHGDMMASTEGHHLYPKGRETLVQLPATPGSLSITLPEGESLIDGVSVQFVLVRLSPGRPFAHSKTVHGARPVTRDRRVRTTAQGIEYGSLRTGRYLVRAVGKYRLATGGLLANGKEWSAEVEVLPGKVTKHQLR